MIPTHFDPERYTAWYAAGGVLALALAPLFGWWLLLVAVPLLILSCLADTRKLYFFGPFLQTELRSQTRKNRIQLWRGLLVLFAGLPVLGFYYVLSYFPPEQQPRRDQVGGIAAGVFMLIYWLMFVVVGTATMQLLSLGISEDRESKRHDFILATDLRGRELVIGKMLTRLLGILAYPAAVLPIVLLMPLLFQLDPAVILFSLAFGGLMLFSVAGLATLSSVLAATKKQGGQWIALFTMPYLLGIFFLNFLNQFPRVWFFPGSATRPPWVSIGDFIEWLSIGNPLALLVKWANVATSGGDVRIVAGDLPAFASFHLLVGGIAFLLAARWVRSTAANSGEVVNPPPGAQASLVNPPVGDEPVLWKDVYCHPMIVKSRQNPRADRIFILLFILFPATVCLASIVSDLGGYRVFILEMSKFYPLIVTWFAMALTSGIGIQSIAREREKDTLLMLVQTALTPEEIVRQKFWAVLRLTKGAMIWQLAIGIPVVLCGSFSWWAYLGLVLFQIVQQFQTAALGLKYSANAPNLLVAQQRFGIACGMVIFPTVIVCIVLLAIFGFASQVRYLLFAVVAPLTLAGLGFASKVPTGELPYWIVSFFIGLLFHSFVAWWLWRSAKRRFLAACDPNSEAGPLFENRAT